MKKKPKTVRQPSIKRVVHVSREYGALAGAGGIKDVVEGLAKASAVLGIDTHVFLPFYRLTEENAEPALKETWSFPVPMHYPTERRFEHVTILSAELQPHLHAHLVKTDRYRWLYEEVGGIERRGIYQYTEQEARALGRPGLKGQGYSDFFAMNVLLVKATLGALGRMSDKPDVIHCHDGHAALLPVLAQASTEGFDPFLGFVPSVLTIHNAGIGYHQEVADIEFAASICGLPREVVHGCLFDGKFDPLYAGGLFCSRLNTVSENYAHELQHSGKDAATGWLGHALASQGVELVGITNGVDVEKYDPKNAVPGLPAAFDPRSGDLSGKEICKKITLGTVAGKDLPLNVRAEGACPYHPDVPLVTFIGRLEKQKGVEVLADALEDLFAADEDVLFLALGTGAPDAEARFRHLADRFRGRVCIALGYNPALADQIYAAGDFLLIPSQYEPCGLTDFYAQLLGNIPLVHRVGGLVKTVDGRFGLSYVGGKAELLECLRRALAMYREKEKATMRRIQADAASNVHKNFTWAKVLEKKYLPLYNEAIAGSAPVLPYPEKNRQARH